MKRKIVIKVQMYCEKCRSNAMKIAVKADGVTKVEIQGAEKDQLVVIGEDVDSVKLTRSLRKLGFRHACLLSVQEEKDQKKVEKPKEEKPKEKPAPIQCSSTSHCSQFPWPYQVVVCDHNPSACSVM